jgi:hypothetical protein
MLVVVLEFKVYVYNFKDFKVIRQVDTFRNPKGLCVVSQLADSTVLVCHGLQKGQVVWITMRRRRSIMVGLMIRVWRVLVSLLMESFSPLPELGECSFVLSIRRIVLYFRKYVLFIVRLITCELRNRLHGS